eukprot:Lankesteria_metandrocarpae@DN3024_c2_g1_i1.p1
MFISPGGTAAHGGAIIGHSAPISPHGSGSPVHPVWGIVTHATGATTTVEPISNTAVAISPTTGTTTAAIGGGLGKNAVSLGNTTYTAGGSGSIAVSTGGVSDSPQNHISRVQQSLQPHLSSSISSTVTPEAIVTGASSGSNTAVVPPPLSAAVSSAPQSPRFIGVANFVQQQHSVTTTTTSAASGVGSSLRNSLRSFFGNKTGSANTISSSQKGTGTPVLRERDNVDVWVEQIIPNWDHERKGGKLLQRLLIAGVPDEVRGEVWKKAVGDRLSMNPLLYEILLERICHLRVFMMQSSLKYCERINDIIYSDSKPALEVRCEQDYKDGNINYTHTANIQDGGIGRTTGTRIAGVVHNNERRGDTSVTAGTTTDA